MIEILGSTQSPEYRAAEKFKHAFETLLDERAIQSSDIRIVVSAKTYGEKRQDIDLVIIGKFSHPIKIPRSSVVVTDALLLSFFLTVEVKDHPPNKLHFSGPKVFVQYRERNEDASEQAEQQKYSAKSYIQKHNLDAPYIVSILLLNNYPKANLPKLRHNILAGDFSAQDVLELIYVAHENKLSSSQVLISSFRQSEVAKYIHVANLFTAKLDATRLDRKKIELITKRNFNQQNYANKDLGTQLLIFAGPGGTGKTVNLLQLAHYVYQERDAKALILTYNLALVSDIRRLMALMGMTDDIAAARVKIATVHSFIYYVLCAVGLFRKGESGFLEKYETLKNSLLENIGAVQKTDVEHWDFVFIDEGQDWPDNERDIVYALYGFTNTVVADGKAQLIRTQSHCDWTKDKTVKSQYVSLSKSLRLKHDICVFVTRVIEGLDIPNWVIEPNVSVFGGKVLIMIGDLSKNREFVERIVEDAKKNGNKEIDLFFCVPPSMVGKKVISDNNYDGDSQRAINFSPFSETLKEWGYNVWDGVDEQERQDYPTKIDQLRIVQYDSCRGLEGWSVINFAVDELFDYKKESFKPTKLESADFFFDEEQAAEQHARKWLAIPLTRAIDTLVINIRDPNHWLVGVFREAAKGNPSVEIETC